jgi:hypothetical protein
MKTKPSTVTPQTAAKVIAAWEMVIHLMKRSRETALQEQPPDHMRAKFITKNIAIERRELTAYRKQHHEKLAQMHMANFLRGRPLLDATH